MARSYLSASWPQVAENRKKGRMNTPGSTVASSPGDRSVMLPARKVSSVINAVLKTLSFSAPSSWVRKKGRKRPSFNRWN